MRQLKPILCLGLGLLLLWGSSAIPLLAGTEPSKGQVGWDRVKQLSPGQEILVVQNNAQSFQGRLQSVRDDSVVIHLTTGEQTLAKNDILRVSARGRSHRLRNLALGAGIGFGGGAGIGAAAGNPHEFFGRDATTLFGAAVGLAGGAAIGVALPTGGWHEVYRAR
jgi:hypothetical protein